MLNKGLLRIFVILFLFATVSPVFSNEYSDEKALVITGKVTTTEGEIIPFANILVLGTVKGTYTNIDGSFEIYDLPDGNYTLKVSAVGYKTFTREVVVRGGQMSEVNLVFEETGVEMPQIDIIANKDRVFSRVPGSVTFIDKREIQTVNPLSGNEVLRRSPGVHVVDEEGLGMRVNIGIRGLDPDRSRSVLVMEDGVPVALSPYGEPEMYYTPAMDRMAGVEILKGSGQILFGPQTIGGVVNYITANPPQEEEGSIYVQGGQGGFFSGLVNYGNTFGNTGIQANLLRKTANNVGPTEFDITDFNTKFLFNLNDKSELGVKLGVYNEVSNSTYIGINQVMFDRGGEDFTRLAPDDQLDVRRYSLSFSHKYRFNKNVRLRTIAYGYTTTRNWSRQDFQINNENTPPANWTGVVWGDREVPGGAIFMRDGTGNRNRQFEVAGVEPRLEIDHKLFNTRNELIVGTRLLYERAFEQRVNGTKAGVKSGNLVEDEVRTGHALAAYVQNKMMITSKFDFNAGVRFESFDYERDIRRRNFPGVGVRDTTLIADNVINEIIPGAGFNYRPVNVLNIFGGVHKGYAPPRTKDAITALGDVLDLEAESSVNYELGFRTEPTKWLFVEATGFVMNFSNQVIPVAESAGGIGFGLVNGGATLNRGVETAVVMDLSNLMGMSRVSLTYDVNATFLRATYSEDRFINGVNINGNRTPYAPNWFINSALTLRTEAGFGLRLVGNFVGEQFGDELNTVEPSADGRIGLVPGYRLFDAVFSYEVEKWNSRFNLSIKNLTDERYIATRRPQGIRVGIPRFITAGYEFRF
ncbi:TonB-dependent receptor [Arthrospiribacter ruber]|uniref:TonB-dependent receptor n=1 Tax=Arthrospiribacter ruber TaxID=2487934 RepID=A0A951IV45_9BACT|nr:TonB-dependent receptor [Arthrospiribacter ruber]MBW3466203.1 TonB-dependent receptor [Arthrospiribacter ruber]